MGSSMAHPSDLMYDNRKLSVLGFSERAIVALLGEREHPFVKVDALLLVLGVGVLVVVLRPTRFAIQHIPQLRIGADVAAPSGLEDIERDL